MVLYKEGDRAMLQRIKEEISKSQANMISYDRFIQLALYDPDGGYYNRKNQKIGKEGDFYTSSHIAPVFSEVFADYFKRVAKETDIPLHICEIGSGDGTFAKGVCDALLNQKEDFTYDLIETSPYHRHLAEEKLGGGSFFKIYESFEQWQRDHKDFYGILFSNEWLDALPVKVVERRDDTWYEVFVTLNNAGDLEETIVPYNNEGSEDTLNHHYSVEDGTRLEIPIYMEREAKRLSEALCKGIVITVDYGYTKEELKHPSRKSGSLRGYSNHNMIHNVLEHPGEMDITHHVHWDTWLSIGEKVKLQPVSVLKQKDFLLSAGILNHLNSHQSSDPFSEEQKKNRAIRSFIMGDQLSHAFDVCIQSKNISKEKVLRPLTNSLPI